MLVDREAECAAVGAFAADATRREGGAMVIAGPQGSGKSSFCPSLRSGAAGRRHRDRGD